MGVHDVGVSRVGWQRRLLFAGRPGAAPGVADLPHLGLPFWSGRAGGADDVRAEAGSHGGLACPAWSGVEPAGCSWRCRCRSWTGRVQSSHVFRPVDVGLW